MAPMLRMLRQAKTAVGGSGRDIIAVSASCASSVVRRPMTTRAGSGLMPAALSAASYPRSRAAAVGMLVRSTSAATRVCPTAEQVRDGLPRAPPVVDEDAVGLDPAWRAVDEDRGEAGPDLRGEVGLVQRRRHEDETVDSPGDEVGDERAFAVGLLVDARGQDDALALAGGVLEAAEQTNREAVAHVLYEDADDSGPPVAATEVARGEVVGVVQSSDGTLDPFA